MSFHTMTLLANLDGLLRARLNGKIVCNFFYYFLIIFQLFSNKNGANRLASLCEKNDFSKIVERSFGFGV